MTDRPAAGAPTRPEPPEVPWLFSGATLVTMDAERRVFTGDLLVRGGRILSLGPSLAANGARVVDMKGRWIIPGLIQGHLHLGQTLFRGLAEERRLLQWLEEVIWPLEARHTEESAYWTAVIGGMEAIRGGTTSILDIGLVHGMGGIFRAVDELGLRAWLGKLLMDRGDQAPAGLVEEPAVAMAESRALAAEWHGAGGGRIHYAVCPRFVYSCSPKLWQLAVAQAAEGGFLMHTHALETREEQTAVLALEQRSEFDTLEAVGALTVPLKIAHGVWLADAEADRLAASGGAVIHCPGSNLKLGSGLADVRGLRGRGVHVGIGCDGSPCNNFLDPMGEIRLAALLQKWKHGPAAFSAREALEMATRGGAEALGALDEIGSLEKGKRADFVVLNLEAIHSLMAPEVDPYTRVVFGADRTNVETVYVGGQPIYDRGRFPGFETARVLARAGEELGALLRRHEMG